MDLAGIFKYRPTKYRTKLYLALMGISLFSTVISLGVVYVEVQSLVFKELQSKVISVAATTAAFVDPELLKQIQSREDEKKPEFHELQLFLRKARDANRRDDVQIRFLYTVMRSKTNPNIIIFGVDAEEDPKNFSHPGDVDEDILQNHLTDHLDKPYSYEGIINDQWGSWLSGYSPVFDKNGNYVATVGADISLASFKAATHSLILFEIPGMIVSLLLAAILATFLSHSASTSVTTICKGVKEIGNGNFEYFVHLDTNDEFNTMADAINQMAKGLKERERLKVGFAHYVSQHVLEKILKSETPTKLEGERRKVTVLFSDIRHFTTLAEKLMPEVLVSILNEYFEGMLEAIFNNQGTFDKFIGDGIMAEFGAPLDDAEQEKHAVLAALAMQKKLKELRQKWEKEGKPPIHMGIGIHTGQAVVGNIGSEERMEYTAIGDTVNVAARLERATKSLNVPIIISEETYKGLKGGFAAKDLGLLSLPGRRKAINAYAIF